MEIQYKNEILRFRDDCNPALPLKVYRETLISGWDIPIRWAIDAEGACYGEYSAHGSTMERSDPKELLSQLRINEDEAGEAMARKALGMKTAAPAWMKAAKSAGWTPPQGFVEDHYDWT